MRHGLYNGINCGGCFRCADYVIDPIKDTLFSSFQLKKSVKNESFRIYYCLRLRYFLIVAKLIYICNQDLHSCVKIIYTFHTFIVWRSSILYAKLFIFKHYLFSSFLYALVFYYSAINIK